MFKSHISNLIKQASTTFSCNPEIFMQNLEILKNLIDKTTAEDVNLHPEFATESLWKRPNKAPVTFIDIFDHNKFTVGIFILKPGMKLPLHNHPHMYGLIKVLMGKVKVTSYSINTEKTNQIDSRNFGGTGFSLNRFRSKNIITAECVSQDIVDTSDGCCVVEPNNNNLHEIESIDGPAAFIDILAPPYETVIPGIGVRKCSYYSILSQVNDNVYKLQEISSPSWYWSDSFPYTGPNFHEELGYSEIY